MYLVFVYDEKKYLVDKFTKETYQEAMIVLAANYGHNPKYEIRKVSNV